ncbi:peptide chain release factor N(5)-glutamine methyltransferase [Erythrobacter sp. sf7]|uniref:Release factor glutamine methyltransferase n=1 Tax=Erythrobacter fulvus TaxID=2987523 RepID=A0ABT5JRW4_9SPHN|nr:peptide chain release factor N(5)-glutamine methyltransferase [Erythrobacter fulvus]MDC8755403.1 peptide chain release factor N(5)-glutamine methyltransferase [Erythrobacter fulvus]
MTVGEALRAAAERLDATSDTARLDAELLMAHALGVSRSDMLLKAMRDPAPEGFAAFVQRRAAHEPVAYITGEAEFYGRVFAVQPGILIPRADSEAVIETALSASPDPRRVLDLGVGSGALLLTVLAERPEAVGVGIDASAIAIDVTGKNAIALGIENRLDLHRHDWRVAGWADDLGSFDLVLCNPPYVEADAALDAQVRDFEPATALFAGPEGLDDYRILIPQLRALMNPAAVAIFEIGANQADAVGTIAQAAGFAVELRRDLAGRPRALILR